MARHPRPLSETLEWRTARKVYNLKKQPGRNSVCANLWQPFPKSVCDCEGGVVSGGKIDEIATHFNPHYERLQYDPVRDHR